MWWLYYLLLIVVTTEAAFTQEERMGCRKHNEFRRVHQVPPMTPNRKMCDQAKAYAQKLAQTATFRHSLEEEREGQGESLSIKCSTNKPVEKAVTDWYNEVCKPGYNFNNGDFKGVATHFTQVVWKESTVLGIGRAEGTLRGTQCAYIVARYKPAGNQAGQPVSTKCTEG